MRTLFKLGLMYLLIHVVWFIGAFTYDLLTDKLSDIKLAIFFNTDYHTYMWVAIGLYIVYFVAKDLISSKKHTDKSKIIIEELYFDFTKTMPECDIFMYDFDKGVIFNNKTKIFEFLKIEVGEDYTERRSYKGFSEPWKKEYYTKNNIVKIPIKDIRLYKDSHTETVSTHEVRMTSKQYHKNKTTVIGKAELILNNNARVVMERTRRCTCLENEPIRNFEDFYDKYFIHAKLGEVKE